MATEYSNLRVLNVDDQPEVLAYHRRILQSLGISNVVEAAGGRAAIRLLTDPTNEFDLIFCDLRMPGLDGVETLRALSYLGVQGGVVILSIEPEEIIAAAGFLAEMHGLHVIGALEKPLTKEKLDPILESLSSVTNRWVDTPRAEPPTAVDIAQGFERGEFTFHFQPLVWFESSALYGVECVLRWKHPVRGLVLPGSFLPAVHRSDALGTVLTDFVLAQGVAFAERWRAGGHEMPVAFNVPGAALGELGFPERLESVAASCHVPHEALRIEVNEQEVVTNPVKILDVATRLRMKRFGVSIDEFGGAEFGLQQLQKSPFTEVKLAPKFVDGCATAPRRQAIIEATIALARNRKMVSVAEGVRNQPDWEFLNTRRCDVAQGNVVVRALPEDILAAWASAWERNR